MQPSGCKEQMKACIHVMGHPQESADHKHNVTTEKTPTCLLNSTWKLKVLCVCVFFSYLECTTVKKAQRTSLLNVNVIGFFWWMNRKAEHPRVTWHSPRAAPSMAFLPASKNAREACQRISRTPTASLSTGLSLELAMKAAEHPACQALIWPVYKYCKYISA